MSDADEPVVVYRFHAGKVESVHGNDTAPFADVASRPLEVPVALPRGPAFEHAAVFSGQSGLRLPACRAFVDVVCFAVDMLISASHASQRHMQLIDSRFPCMALSLEPGDGGLYLRGAVRLRHAGTNDMHWCGVRAARPIRGSSDMSSDAAQHAFSASNAGWACLTLVFTGDDLVLLQDGVVVARRVFHAAVLASAPGDVHDLGAALGSKAARLLHEPVHPDGVHVSTVLPRPVSVESLHESVHPGGVHVVGADLDGGHALHGAVAAVRLWNGVPAPYRAALDAAERAGVGELASKRAELDEGALRGALGRELRAERGLRLAGVPGRICEHEHGALLWSRATGAHAVFGAIYRAYGVSGWRGRLGWPIADERTSRAAGGSTVRVQRFQRGAIVCSDATGAHPVHGAMFARWLALGAEHGVLGLPVQPPQRWQHGVSQSFQHGRLVHSDATGAHALHGPTLARYLVLPRRMELLGLPVSDTMPIHGDDGALLGHVSRFERGAIYWSPQNGAWEICGRLALHYQCCGGPLGGLGFPVATAHDRGRGTTHARFEHGLIVHRADIGTHALHAVRLRFERVRRVRNASVPAFAVRLWLRVGSDWVHRGTRLPAQGYATAGVVISLSQTLPVQPDTVLWMKVEICDHEHRDRVVGAIEQRFDIAKLWGAWSGARGRHELPITVDRDPYAFLLAVRVTPVAAVAPARMPADPSQLQVVGSRAFARLGWWRFGNFRVRALEPGLLAASFREPLRADSACWPEPPGAPGLLASSFDDVAGAGVAANGAGFGMVTAAVHALASHARPTQPVYRHHLAPEVRDVIVRCHAQQLGAEVIAWFVALLARPEQLSPRAVFDHVERELRAGTPVPLCIYDVPGDRGDCVLAYACTRVGEEHGRIYVVDPNAPRVLDRSHARFIRVRADDTFELVHDPERFRSQRAGEGLLPDVLLLPVPYHVLASLPGMPAADPSMALEALLGGLVFLSGDAEMDQIASHGQELLRKLGGRRHLVAHALPGLIRVPRLESSPSSQIFAQRGLLPEDFELVVKGTKARGGRFALCVGTDRAEVRIESSIVRAALDTFALRAVHASLPSLHLSTTMPDKLVSVAYRVQRDPRGRGPRGVALDLPLAPDAPACVRLDGPGGAVIVQPSGLPQPMDVTLEAPAGRSLQRLVLRGLMVTAPGEALCIRPRDWSALGGEIMVERLAGQGGPVLARDLARGHPQ